MGCTVVCTGVIAGGVSHPPPPFPPPITTGCATVLIHGMPAARWLPSLDMGGCGAFLGDLALGAARTVKIGT